MQGRLAKTIGAVPGHARTLANLAIEGRIFLVKVRADLDARFFAPPIGHRSGYRVCKTAATVWRQSIDLAGAVNGRSRLVYADEACPTAEISSLLGV